MPTDALAPATPDAPDGPAGEPPVGGEVDEGRLARWFGPLTGLRVVALLVAVAFLAGAVAFVVGERRGGADPLSAVDVGFMQDMSYHHQQAVQMSLILIGKPGIQSDVRGYATEIIVDQRYEIGLMNATLDRFGHPSAPGALVMGWMGPALPRDQMPGLATAAEMARLQQASGADAEALWIAMMARHHLGGIHMADEATRRGHDAVVRNLALAMEKSQRNDVYDHDTLRRRLGLPIPPGFTDPTKSPALFPLSLTGS